jgi:hypothetical protein
MKMLIAAIGFLLAISALAGGGNLVVQLTPSQQSVAQGDAPHFIITVTSVSLPSRIIKFAARPHLKDAYVRLVVTRDGAEVDVPVAISDPGPVDKNDYIELSPGHEMNMTLEHDGFTLGLSKLPPGIYSVTVNLRPDWSAAPVKSNSVSFRVVSHLKITRRKALVLAEEAAKKEGYEVNKFHVSDFISHLSDDGKEWVFLFQCWPNPPPDCGFFAHVDSASGKSRIYPDAP